MLRFIKFLFSHGVDESQALDRQGAEVYLDEYGIDEPDDLALAAVNRGNRAQFVQFLAERGMWLITRLDIGEYEGDVHLLEYEEGERNILPVFSSLAEAMAFVHTVDLSEMLALQYMHVSAEFLTHNDLSHHKIVMNPFAGATTEISPPDIQNLGQFFHGL